MSRVNLPTTDGWRSGTGQEIPEIMFCSACGTKVTANAQFCFRCGARLEEVIAAATESDEPPPLPSTSTSSETLSVDGRALPPLPPPLPTSAAAAAAESASARGKPWVPGAVVVVLSMVWLEISGAAGGFASLAGFWLGSMIVVAVMGAVGTGVLALFPPLRRRFKGRWLSIFAWTSAVMLSLSMLGATLDT